MSFDNKKKLYWIGKKHSEGGSASNDSTKNATQNSPIISVQNLVKQYKVGRQTIRALNDVSLDIYRGEFVSVMGASGSGKSTLLQMMGGLDKPTSGTVAVNGVRLDKMSDRKLSMFRNQTIGFVFQFFYLQPFLRLDRNLEIAAIPNRTKNLVRQQRVQDLLERVGLRDRATHYPREMSGGQIQRAAIARALFNQPGIILADEPTGNLDSKNSQEIMSLFEAACRELGTTIVIATHDEEVAALTDRIITMRDGSIQ